ncbi:MAG TPA: peptidoglycan-binding domain-containing protein [Stellaceae bacterium]|nr:peptidoglycan-binding domain-containing protein [Stellaceae bacterium]
MRTGFLGAAALVLLTAACGTSQEQRSATGGLTGLGVGALVGGPVGAIVGTAAGAAGGAMMPEDATSIANNLLGREHRAARNMLGEPPASTASNVGNTAITPPGTAASGSSVPPGLVKQAQNRLRNAGLYNGRIDGIVGPKTRHGLAIYQQQQGLPQTGRLDRPTVARMNLLAEGPPPASPASPESSGSSAPHDVPPQNPPPANAAPPSAAPQNAGPGTPGAPPPAAGTDQSSR